MARISIRSIIAFLLWICTIPVWAAGPKFLVVSDLGAYGDADQKKVASSLGDAAWALGPDAIIDLGDTFHYWGVQSVDDPGWISNFESIYTEPSLHNLWYAVLGNHEYQGNTQALIDYTQKSRRWNMPAHYYTKQFRRGDTTVKFIFIDTTPMLRRALTQPEIFPDASEQDMEAQLSWLRQELADTVPDWVVVAGHHPVYSGRSDTAGQRADVQAHLEDILAENRPDLYLAGDVHCFEHTVLPDIPTDYVTCSSGSQAYPLDPAANVLFADGHTGFVTLVFDKDRFTFTMLDALGNPLYEFTREKTN